MTVRCGRIRRRGGQRRPIGCDAAPLRRLDRDLRLDDRLRDRDGSGRDADLAPPAVFRTADAVGIGGNRVAAGGNGTTWNDVLRVRHDDGVAVLDVILRLWSVSPSRW
ncbi:MAG: hypothetical protein R2705_08545 [Ilumatobacteraceae bacterium]